MNTARNTIERDRVFRNALGRITPGEEFTARMLAGITTGWHRPLSTWEAASLLRPEPGVRMVRPGVYVAEPVEQTP